MLEINPNPGKAAILGAITTAFTAVFFLFFIASESEADFFSNPILYIVAFAGGAILGLVGSFFTAKKTVYVFSDQGVEYTEGFFTQQRKTVTYDRITDSNFLKRFPLDHLLNTGTIQLRTAGGKKGGIKLKYIDNADDQYEAIKLLINGQKNGPSLNNSSYTANKEIASSPIGIHASEEEIYSLKPSLKPTQVGHLMFSLLILLGGIVLSVIFMIILEQNSYGFEGQIWIVALTTGIITLILLIIQAIVFYFQLKNTQAKTYHFFRDRIEFSEGFLTVRKKTIKYDRITDLGLVQGWLWEKFMNVSRINISTAGTAGNELVLRDIANGEMEYQKVQSFVNASRSNTSDGA